MKREYEIDLNTFALEDLMISDIMHKKYPEKIDVEVKKLQKVLLEQLKEMENYNSMDIVNSRYFIEERTKDNRTNRIELNWECFLASDMLRHYFEEDTKNLPESVWKKAKELQDEIDKYLPHHGDYLDEDTDMVYIQEMEYEEPNF